MLDKRYDNNTLGGSALNNSAPPHERVHSQTNKKTNGSDGSIEQARTTTTTVWLEIQEHHDVNDVIVVS